MIIDIQESNAWKIHLTIAINFISSKDSEEECECTQRTTIQNLHLVMM